MRHRSTLVRMFAVVATVVGLIATAAVSAAAATGPTSDGATATVAPASGGKGVPSLAATSFDLASVGYEQSEYYLAGTATAYTSAKPLTSDGRWTVTPGATAPYRTRMVIYRPSDPAKFNGTVIVEWNNVSGGLDAAPIWIAAHDELIREGYAWVGVTAQQVGVQGGGRGALVANLDLLHADPARYGTLVHPGDSFSYDMFTQAGRAVRSDAAQVLGGLKPKHVIGAGESQSAFRLTTYIDGIQPITKGVYDGYFVYSRGGAGAALSQAPQPEIAAPDPTLIRTDLDVPVMTFITETDLAFKGLGYLTARQPDTGHFRDWEVAGTSHADTYTLGVAGSDTGTPAADAALFQTMVNPPSKLYGGIINCDTPIDAGPMTYVLRSAIDSLNRWVTTGKAPPKAPRLAVVAGSSPTKFQLDADGNVKGGIRTPQVDAPVATLSGLGQSGTGFCAIFGTTLPFTAPALAQAYPTHAAFVQAWDAATDRAVKEGFIVKADAAAIKSAAAQSTIGS